LVSVHQGGVGAPMSWCTRVLVAVVTGVVPSISLAWLGGRRWKEQTVGKGGDEWWARMGANGGQGWELTVGKDGS